MTKDWSLLLFLIVVPSLTLAKVNDFQVFPSEIKFFLSKDVCKKMGHLEVLSPSFPDLNNIECMGKLHPLFSACEKMKKVESMHLLRAYYDKEQDALACQYGRSATLVLSCDKRDRDKFCGHEKEGCGKLKDIFAKNLDLIHSSMGEAESGLDELRCYFAKKKNLEINDRNANNALFPSVIESTDL